MNKFNTFNEVKDASLQTWNRCNLMRNIVKSNGQGVARKYSEQFSKTDQTKMFVMFAYIQKKGYDFVEREIIRNSRLEA